MRPEPQAVVRSTLPEAEAMLHAPVRRVVREPVTAKPTPAAHGVSAGRAGAVPAAGAAGQGERG